MYPRHILPGIAVEVPPPAFPDALPRMDVALFVGFAARGPVHQPVMIESVADYAQVFGGDLILARDMERGLNAMAALAPAVRGFFSNGGTRCWVIRTCRTESVEARWRGRHTGLTDCASARTFTVPFLGPVQASSVGSWADDMRVSARIDRTGAQPRFVLRAMLGAMVVDSGPFAFDPGAPDSWSDVIDDDRAYSDANAVAQRRALVAPSGPLTGCPSDDSWSEPVGPDPDGRTPLERDGLSRFDAELFLDPALATMSVAGLSAEAQRIRDIDGRTLAGLHGAFAVPGGVDYGEPSLIAVPDAVQPGWSQRLPEPFVPPRPQPAETLDTTRFLNCSTRQLATPIFVAPKSPQPTGSATLTWSASETGATYILEESARADFKGAEEIWRGTALSLLVETAREGPYYYRLHAERDGNISASSVTGFIAQDSAWVTVPSKSYDDQPLINVQRALLRTCAAMGDQFAPLSLPRHYGPQRAAAHSAALRAAFPFNEHRALSFGALYHPWLVSPLGATLNPALIETPPEGALLGTYARRARIRGPWIAPANVAIEDIVALSPAITFADRTAFARAGVNLIRSIPDGFVATDALTLSDEYEWDKINVRRLMSLLRRVCVRRGNAFVFEPNGDVVRRAIERTFGHMLDDLVRRGAFAGKGNADSHRLSVNPSDSDRMNGRLIIEIAVAPSQPLRFLTLVLAQAGERLTFAEER
jgi:Phage tail sheath C-terminal domain